ncbi:unnamed protein product [Calicophoron daubneyi]|uniref:NADPH-dependent diflavin oxidoreductase 1 n=1 Tax=Calicophoron daubneyi TaxID=300641 RepID=A0AAV2TXY4_CALDB
MSCNPGLVILYGSQTGIAHGLAERMISQANYLFNDVGKSTVPEISLRLLSMNEYTPISRLVKERAVLVFVCSTTGYGVPPDNMLQFWRRLMHKSLPVGQALPSTLRFSVLGLGDSSYSKYNVVAKKLYWRLLQLGAKPLELLTEKDDKLEQVGGQHACGLGLADEQADLGLNGCLSWWIPRLWEHLAEHWGIQLAAPSAALSWSSLESPEMISKFWPRFRVTIVDHLSREQVRQADGTEPDNITEEILRIINEDSDVVFQSHPFYANAHFFRVVENKRITAEDHFQDTRLITLKPEEGTNPKFLPGDCLFVHPRNRTEDAVMLLSTARVDPNERVVIGSNNVNFPLPPLLAGLSSSEISAAWLAMYYFDLNATPTPSFFMNMAGLAYSVLKDCRTSVDPTFDHDRLILEYERLRELGSVPSVDALEDFYAYATRPHRRVAEVLIDFPMTTLFLSLDRWFDVLPGPVRARPYSIASSPPVIQLLVAVVTYRTQMSTPRYGLASHFLSVLKSGDQICGWIASDMTGGFRFNRLLNTAPPPCLLVGAGTGVAPFRSFIWHQQTMLPECPTVANILCFGCRYSNKDFYFADEWSKLESESRLRLLTAFSREDSTNKQSRVYVQHRLVENDHMVWPILSNPSAFVFVVGNTKSMPNSVCEALVTCCRNAGGLSQQDAEEWIKKMIAEDRIQVESWA